MKKRIALVIIFLISTNINSANAGNEILLKSRRFTPVKGITATARAKIEATPERAHILIQLERIPTIRERKELEASGIRLLSYVPNKAWFASIPSDKASEIAALLNVRAISEILPEDKISPHIRAGEFFWERVKDGKADFIVEFFKDVSLEEAELVIEKYKGSIVGRVPTLNALVITAQIEESIDLGFEEAVKWVEQELPLEELNDGVRAAIGVDTVQDPPYNLNGTDIDVLVYDSGLVDYTHDDFGSRVTLGEPGSTSDHSTHVAGTVGGDGSRSEAEGGTPLQWRGMAPAVDIISYYVSGSCDWWLEPPVCLYDDSGQMADMDDNFNEGITTYGADIGTASVGAQPARWGISCEYEGDYSPYAQLIDTIIYNRSIPITWAAANERGYVTCGTTYNTISPTATGKNAIIVGATNSNDDSMTSFSSWGPTDDGRIKPDIVAPGCQVGVDWGITSTWPGDTYASKCGTSMATPAVAGSVALMLEDWRDTHTGDPLPSTIKAILIQTAVDLGNTGPDYSYGYGLINVKESIDLIREDTCINIITEDSIIEQDDKDYFTINVPAGQLELKITLVWDDYPGDPAADKALINDLDLIVKDPNGIQYYPWTLDPTPGNEGNPAVRSQPDHLNNIEQVYVDNPVSGSGTWTIEISGTTMPEPVQNYSLVWSFTTDNYFVVEDFDSYADHAALRAVWATGHLTGNGAQLSLEKDPDYVHDGNSMLFAYRNFTDIGGYVGSEAEASIADLPSQIGSDWTTDGVEALVLYFFGDAGNAQEGLYYSGYHITNDQMYVALEDGSANVGIVKYDTEHGYDMNDIKEASWHEWDIDLADPCLADVNLANVAKVYIGFGGQKTGQSDKGAGAKSGNYDTVWFDDIRLYSRPIPQDPHKFYIKNNSDETVAWFGNLGNLVLKGTFTSGEMCTPPPDSNSFIIRNSTNETVAYIDNEGNLCIEGDWWESCANCNPTTDAFIIRDSSDANVSYIDFEYGDLCLTGRLYPNSNP